MSDQTKLSSNITVRQYREMVKDEKKDDIADFLVERFQERFITPFSNSHIKHGFSMMSIACLMIESLESFRQGWTNSNRKSARAFGYFFSRCKGFENLRRTHQEFYKHVRCGLLHQAETTGGWKIDRKEAELFNSSTKTLNATKFLKALEQGLSELNSDLKKSDWNSELWKNTRKKMEYICKQAEAI